MNDQNPMPQDGEEQKKPVMPPMGDEQATPEVTPEVAPEGDVPAAEPAV